MKPLVQRISIFVISLLYINYLYFYKIKPLLDKYYKVLEEQEGTISSTFLKNEEEIPSKLPNHENPSAPLNVLILYPDDWRHDDIGGVAPIVRTPFLNQLASKGIRFTHNAVTTSICWISRATLFTGQYVSRHGSTYLPKPLFATHHWNTTWPYLLQQKGYFVGHIGKWQYDNVDNYLSRIFNWSRFYEGSHWYPTKEGPRIAAADRTRNDVFEFLDNRPKDTPFALTVAFYPPKAVGIDETPGGQWFPTNETKKLYENDTIPPPPYNTTEAFQQLPEFLHHPYSLMRGRWRQRWRTSEHYQEGMKNYYALITHVDSACEQIVNRLKEHHLLNTTMILFTTDNGLMHGAHGLAGKWLPHEESIRVPLIIYDPRMPPNKRGTLDDSLTLNIDLAETILGAANISSPPMMQGRDISDLYLPPPSPPLPLNKKTNEPWRTEFFYEYPIGDGLPLDPRVTALIRKDWKYIHWTETNHHQLFHLRNDPHELHDLIENLSNETIQLLKQLHDSTPHKKDFMTATIQKMEENFQTFTEMKKRHDELKWKVMEPIIPGSKCDPLWPRYVQIPDNATDC